MFNKYRIIHFVGIGGVGMSGIAEVLHNLGYEITGSDIKESETTRRLKEMGIRIFLGHRGDNIDNAHVVVISSAVHHDNPEVVEARQRSIPVIPRAEMLAELGRLKYGVLVAGSHGKTTTTSLIATIFNEGGLDPTVVIGGKLKSLRSNARLGQGDYLVAEADESDGSFLKLNPAIAVITNIDREHMDFFKDIDSLKKAFLEFINKIPFYGAAIVCRENGHIRDMLPLIQRRVITYGLTDEADVYAVNIRNSGIMMTFEPVYRGRNLGEFNLPVPGVHNVLNGLAAIAVAIELHVPVETISNALSDFSGIQRRFEFKGEAKGIKFFDDYGHHPAEIKAVIETACRCFDDKRIIVLFQPHRYTRTRDLMNEFAGTFAESLGSRGSLFLMDIYPAGESPIVGISSERLLECLKETGFKNAIYIPDKSEIIERVVSELRSGDVLITLGAGNVYKAGEEILKELRIMN